MKTNRTKRSVFFCRAAALIALAAVCMIGCQNATDGSDGNSNGGGNTPQSAVEKYVVVFNADTSHVGALTAKVDGKEIHPGDRVEQGKIVEFTAQPESGKRADTWFIEGGSFEAGSGTAGSDTAKVRVLNNISVRVSFKDVEAGKHIVRFSIEGSAGESRLSAAVAGGSAILSGNEVSDGSVVEFTARPESGKTVDRWFIEGGNFEAGSGTAGSDTARVKVSGNINVRVAFKDADPNKHIVTFGIEGNAGESAVTAKVTEGWRIASGNEVRDGAFVEFTAVPAPGYKVKSWTIVKTEDNNPLLFEEGGTGGSLRAKARAACNLSVKVEFERIIYTIMFGFEGSSDQGTFTAQKDGADFVSGATAFYGEELAFSAQPKAGWKVAVWTIVNTDDSSPLTFEEGGTEGSLSAKAKVTCNITVKVKFEKIICTVSFTVPGGHGSLKAKAEGAAFVSVSPVLVEYGKTVEFIASPTEGYKVKAWTVDGNTVTADSTYSLTIVQDINLTVTFTEDNVRITIRGDERVDEEAAGYIDIPRGKTWGDVKKQIKAKFALKGEWQGGDYGLYRWALDNENGNTISDNHVFTEDTVVYAVTNYLKFEIEGTKLIGYDGAEPRGRIIIDDGVTKIGKGAFFCCTGLTGELKLPASLTMIEGTNDYNKKGAFESCTGLQRVDFSACTALTKIGSDAFFRCTGLTGELKLPASLTEVGERAFYECKGLQGVDFSACTALTKIGEKAFEGCTSLTGELKLPASLTEIGERAFYKCKGLQGVDFSACTKLTEIGAAAFSRCTGLTGELKLPASLTEIGDGAFYSCTGLTGILKLPANLKVIDRGVLLGGAFCKCTGITGLDFSACKKLTEIGDYAFSGCTGLRGGLELPASLTEIGNAVLAGVWA
ncbi:leucine-rich repeat protein [Treponema socranskii]|uniref:leucine-rich repeat domain-containing protein n=1 Tax=Treponema socranskii TaxID=53419 RepID=UPI003D6EBFBD